MAKVRCLNPTAMMFETAKAPNRAGEYVNGIRQSVPSTRGLADFGIRNRDANEAILPSAIALAKTLAKCDAHVKSVKKLAVHPRLIRPNGTNVFQRRISEVLALADVPNNGNPAIDPERSKSVERATASVKKLTMSADLRKALLADIGSNNPLIKVYTRNRAAETF